LFNKPNRDKPLLAIIVAGIGEGDAATPMKLRCFLETEPARWVGFVLAALRFIKLDPHGLFVMANNEDVKQ
jgi:hypothetical protein